MALGWVGSVGNALGNGKGSRLHRPGKPHHPADDRGFIIPAFVGRVFRVIGDDTQAGLGAAGDMLEGFGHQAKTVKQHKNTRRRGHLTQGVNDDPVDYGKGWGSMLSPCTQSIRRSSGLASKCSLIHALLK